MSNSPPKIWCLPHLSQYENILKAHYPATMGINMLPLCRNILDETLPEESLGTRYAEQGVQTARVWLLRQL